MCEVDIDHIQQKIGQETIWGWGQLTCANGEIVKSWETGLKTIQLFKVQSLEKDYLANATVENKGQFDNEAVVHIYRINPDGTVEQAPYTVEVDLSVDFAGE